MTLLPWIIVFTLLGGVLSVLAAGLFLLLSESLRARLLPHAVSFAIGALLGAAFLAILPHAIEGAMEHGGDIHHVTLAVLLGVLGFFLLERMVLWRHCHTSQCEAHGVEHVHDHHHSHGQASGYLIAIGDGIHNFVDGILIAAAFMTDIHLGVVTALAVAAHEIPQEVGDFAILLHSGFSRQRALLYNILSSITTVFGGVLAYYSLGDVQRVIPFVLAIAASSFIYIAVADLIPGLHRRLHLAATVQQVSLIAAGVLVIYLAHSSLH